MGYEGVNAMVTKLQGGTPVARMDIPTRSCSPRTTRPSSPTIRRSPASSRADRSGASTVSIRPRLLDCRASRIFGGVRALRGVDFAVTRRPRARAGRRERGRQVDPDQDHRRALPGRCRHACARRQRRSSLRGTDDALERGIVTVHQDINLIPTPDRGREHLPRQRADHPVRSASSAAARCAHERATLLERYGIAVPPDTPVADLPNDQRKMVQILKAISRRRPRAAAGRADLVARPIPRSASSCG